MITDMDLFQKASDLQFKEKDLKKAYACYAELIETFPNSDRVYVARSMMSAILKEDDEIRANGTEIIEKVRAEKEQKEKERVQFANSFNEFYEYDVVSVINREHGLADKEEIRRVLMEHAEQGWKLHTMYSNELGKKALVILGFGTNSTACEDVMIFERRVQQL